MWYEGILNATNYSLMLMRSRSKQIKFDICKLQQLYNNKQDEIILRDIYVFTNSLKNVKITKDFIKKFLSIVKNFEFFSDSFYSYIPLMCAVYQFWAMNFHKNLREILNNFWNEKIELMKPQEVMDIIEAL